MWFGNVVSNPGAPPNLPGAIPYDEVPAELQTSDHSSLQRSFDLKAMDEDFAFPNVTAQLRKFFDFGPAATFTTSLAYSFTRAENVLKTTEIASVLWQNNPVGVDPNDPELGFAKFGQPHRFIATATYLRAYGGRYATSLGLFATVARGNQYLYAGGNRYSFIYADVNGDGEPVLDFVGPQETFLDDVSEFSRWRAQFGLRYLFGR